MSINVHYQCFLSVVCNDGIGSPSIYNSYKDQYRQICRIYSSFILCHRSGIFCQIEEVFGYTGTQPWIATTSYANGKMLSEHPSVLLTIHIPMQIFIPVQLVILAADGKTGIDLGTL